MILVTYLASENCDSFLVFVSWEWLILLLWFKMQILMVDDVISSDSEYWEDHFGGGAEKFVSFLLQVGYRYLNGLNKPHSSYLIRLSPFCR